jgi:Fic family protein
MVAARRIIAISVDADQHRTLVEISRSRTEPANRVERAGIILAYLDEPSAYAVARAIGVSQQTVTRCLQRAAELGVLAALDDRARTARGDDYGRGQSLACRAGLREANAIRLPA